MQVPGWGGLCVAVLTRPCTHSANPVHGLQVFSINRFSLAHLAERTLCCAFLSPTHHWPYQRAQ